MATNKTLAKIAAYGGIAAISGALYFRWRIHGKLREMEYYQKSLNLLQSHSAAMDLLGKPIMAGNVDLGDTKHNFCDAHQAQFEVPIKGQKENGTLYLWAQRDNLQEPWNISRLELSLAKDTSKRLLVHDDRASGSSS